MKKNIIAALAVVMIVIQFFGVASVFGQGNETSAARSQATTQRLTKWQAKGGKAIDSRIVSLNNLMSRVGQMKNLTANDKASINATIQALVTNLTTLKNQINSATSTTALEVDIKSITVSNRIYMLVEPQLRIVIAADRIRTIVTQLATITGKVQARLSQNPTASQSSSVQTALTDITAKLNSANNSAQAAVNEVIALKPDNGDKTLMNSNLTTLKDAQTKIKNAQQDLKDARKDITTITKVLGKENKNATTTSSTATTTSQ